MFQGRQWVPSGPGFNKNVTESRRPSSVVKYIGTKFSGLNKFLIDFIICYEFFQTYLFVPLSFVPLFICNSFFLSSLSD